MFGISNQSAFGGAFIPDLSAWLKLGEARKPASTKRPITTAKQWNELLKMEDSWLSSASGKGSG